MDKTELAPCFLVAAPSLDCPFFRRAVVLLLDHREDGSLGFVVNRTGDLSLGDVLREVGLAAAEGALLGAPVQLGGPVSPESGWVVFDPRTTSADGVDALRVSEALAVTASPRMLEQLAGGDARAVLFLGYAGWGPGQLDEEIRRGSWIAVDLDPALVFDARLEERWSLAFASLGIVPDQIGTAVLEA